MLTKRIASDVAVQVCPWIIKQFNREIQTEVRVILAQSEVSRK